MKKVILQQPRWLPWSGHWHKVAAADVHILYCGVKFDRTDYIHRVKVGAGEWLTIPLAPEANNQLICDMKLGKEYKFHFAKMAKTIRFLYMGKKWPYAERLDGLISTLERWNSDDFVETAFTFHQIMAGILGIKTLTFIDTKDRSEMGKVEKIDSVLKYYLEEPFAYMMGSGSENYMKGAELTTPSEVWIQNQKKPCYFGSILRNIVAEENPLAEAMDCFEWRKL